MVRQLAPNLFLRIIKNRGFTNDRTSVTTLGLLITIKLCATTGQRNIDPTLKHSKISNQGFISNSTPVWKVRFLARS